MYRYLMSPQQLKDYRTKVKVLGLSVPAVDREEITPKSTRYINSNLGVLFNPQDKEAIDLAPSRPNFKVFVQGIWQVELQTTDDTRLICKSVEPYSSYLVVKVGVNPKIFESNSIVCFLGAIRLKKDEEECQISFWWNIKNNV